MALGVACPHCGFRLDTEAQGLEARACCPRCRHEVGAGHGETEGGRTVPGAAGPAVLLTVVDGPMLGQEFRFEEHDTFVFGRAASCHASLPNDSFVSRHHFLLEANPPQVCLRDLGSRNGTWVNELRYGGAAPKTEPGKCARPAHEEAALEEGDCIRAGKTIFAVGIEDECQGIRCGQCGRPAQWTAAIASGSEYRCEACGETTESTSVSTSGSEGGGAADSKGAAFPSIEGYSLARGLGRGGMGAVYLVTREQDGLEFAMKLMLSRTALAERRRQSFLREMELLAGLDHPNIVQLVDQGVVGNTFFFVMAYCAGGDVGGLVKASGGRLPMEQALSILLDVLSGLAYAHDQGLVHRDIKPSNLLLGGSKSERVVKLSDFGLAKSFEMAGLSGMTTTGMTAGTCAFMPREQVTDFRYVRPASDVWSIAAAFYFTLTGHPPREGRPGQDPLEVILGEGAVPIAHRLPTIPPQLAAVIDKALRTNPDERHETAIQLRAAIKEALPGE